MSDKPPDPMLSAASKNEGLMLYAGFNFAQSSGGEQSNELEDAAINQGAQMAGAAVAATLGLPPELGAKVGGMLADKMKEDKEKNKEGNENKASSTVPTLFPAAPAA